MTSKESGIRKLRIAKHLCMEDIWSMCVKYQFYTCGTCCEYEKLLSKCCGCVSDEELEEIALDIVEHSSGSKLAKAFFMPDDCTKEKDMAFYVGEVFCLIANKYSTTMAFS